MSIYTETKYTKIKEILDTSVYANNTHLLYLTLTDVELAFPTINSTIEEQKALIETINKDLLALGLYLFSPIVSETWITVRVNFIIDFIFKYIAAKARLEARNYTDVLSLVDRQLFFSKDSTAVTDQEKLTEQEGINNVLAGLNLQILNYSYITGKVQGNLTFVDDSREYWSLQVNKIVNQLLALDVAPTSLEQILADFQVTPDILRLQQIQSLINSIPIGSIWTRGGYKCQVLDYVDLTVWLDNFQPGIIYKRVDFDEKRSFPMFYWIPEFSLLSNPDSITPVVLPVPVNQIPSIWFRDDFFATYSGFDPLNFRF
jgi:hypothetical protein